MTKTTTGIPPHYKQTQLGLIPVEWEVTELGKIGKVISGLTYSPDDVDDIGTLVLRSSNIQNESLSFEDNVYVNTEKLQYNPVKEGDVLICVRNGSKNLIGKNTLITKEVEGFAFGAFMTVYRSEFNSFLIHYFKTDFYNREIHKNLGATINSINGSELKKFKVPLPPLPEQQKIAAILSTWDRAIAQQQQLIAAKQQFKKGLMQRLLTGKQRFAGFEGEWEEVKLFKVCEFKNGKAHEQIISDDGEFVVVNSKFISTNGEIRKFTSQQVSPLFKNEIVMVMSDVPNGRALAKCYLIEEDQKYSLNQRICSLKAKDIEPLFLYYQLNRNKYYLKFNDGIGQTNLKKKEVLNCPIFKPSRAEQIKILSILSSADQEINVLQTQLTQLQTQKRGLMQGLLTGAVRVKI